MHPTPRKPKQKILAPQIWEEPLRSLVTIITRLWNASLSQLESLIRQTILGSTRNEVGTTIKPSL